MFCPTCFFRTSGKSDRPMSIVRLKHEFPVFVDDLGLPVLEMRRHGAAGGRDNVGVYGGVVEAKLLRLCVSELRDISRKGVTVTHAERHMGVAVRPAHVLVV